MNLGRRDLMRFGLGASGALLVEIALPGCGARSAADAKTGAFAPNAWIKITPDDKVHFILDRVEMGQGTMTSHAQLVAEELEIDPRSLVIDLAPADRAYDNPDSQLGFQVTGGSTSVGTSFDPLRTAAATTREMLRQAAAKRWGVALAACVAQNGIILHPPSGKSARYGDLTVDAARERVRGVKLKPSSAQKVIGTSLPRLDAPSKVDGSAVYGIDVRLPGLLGAVILRPPALGAKLTSFDATDAKGDPGFVDAIAVPSGVAVLATSYWRARRAAAKVRVTWSGGDPNLDTDNLRKRYRARLARDGPATRSDGSVSGGERSAARIVDAIYEAPYLAHATLEPQNATAVVKDGRCEVWAPTQSPGLAREALRRLTGYAYDDIVVHQTLVGGGYGRRLVQDSVVEAATIALRVGRPVKVVWSREEDTRHDFYRPMALTLLRAGISKDGSITSWFQRVATQSIVGQIAEEWGQSIVPNRVPLSFKRIFARGAQTAYVGSALPDEATTEGAADLPYAIPNVGVEYAAIRVDVPVGWWRSVGYSFNVFATEAFFDEVARAAGRDPIDLRRQLLTGSKRHARVLALAAEKAGWPTSPRLGVFRGAAVTRAFKTYGAMVAEVSVEGRDVRVHKVVAAIDCGKVVNPDLVRAQVEGGIGFGLGAALKQEITLKRGSVEQSNFHDFESLRLHEMPEVEVHIVASDEPPTGVGEPPVPLVAPAVANAILAATGKPVRRMPLRRAMEEGT
jgi:CO/xanthine dehydrogenase Mo-binding subunit